MMSDEGEDLTWIPNTVRAKLDRAGVRIHLADWQRLSREARRELIAMRCEGPDEVAAFRARLQELVPGVR